MYYSLILPFVNTRVLPVPDSDGDVSMNGHKHQWKTLL